MEFLPPDPKASGDDTDDPSRSIFSDISTKTSTIDHWSWSIKPASYIMFAISQMEEVWSTDVDDERLFGVRPFSKTIAQSCRRLFL